MKRPACSRALRVPLILVLLYVMLSCASQQSLPASGLFLQLFGNQNRFAVDIRLDAITRHPFGFEHVYSVRSREVKSVSHAFNSEDDIDDIVLPTATGLDVALKQP